MEKKEDKIYPRTEIIDPSSYVNPDDQDNLSEEIIGTIRKINKNGIQIVTFQEFPAESVTLRFVESENKKTEIEGRVISCSRQQTGIFTIGIEFQGTAEKNIEFVKKISSIMPLIYQPRSIDKPASNKDSGSF